MPKHDTKFGRNNETYFMLPVFIGAADPSRSHIVPKADQSTSPISPTTDTAETIDENGKKCVDEEDIVIGTPILFGNQSK